MEARRLAGVVHQELLRGIETSNRVVLAPTNDDAAAAAAEARDASAAVMSASKELRDVLEQLGYGDERDHLNTFDTAFALYAALENEVMTLALEGSNQNARRLAFGPGVAAANRFRAALQSATATGGANPRAGELAATAVSGVLEIQAILPRHIEEPEDEPMTRMEADMARAEKQASAALGGLRDALPAASADLSAAMVAFEEFLEINREVVTLSRRNSNVRALALTIGRKRVLAAQSVDAISALQDRLNQREFTATR